MHALKQTNHNNYVYNKEKKTTTFTNPCTTSNIQQTIRKTIYNKSKKLIKKKDKHRS
jgi:hypothetical protein